MLPPRRRCRSWHLDDLAVYSDTRDFGAIAVLVVYRDVVVTRREVADLSPVEILGGKREGSVGSVRVDVQPEDAHADHREGARERITGCQRLKYPRDDDASRLGLRGDRQGGDSEDDVGFEMQKGGARL